MGEKGQRLFCHILCYSICSGALRREGGGGGDEGGRRERGVILLGRVVLFGLSDRRERGRKGGARVISETRYETPY